MVSGYYTALERTLVLGEPDDDTLRLWGANVATHELGLSLIKPGISCAAICAELNAFLEAEAHAGPLLIIAFSPCIAHGVDMSNNHRQQDMAVKSGHWPLFRFNPENIPLGKPPKSIV